MKENTKSTGVKQGAHLYFQRTDGSSSCNKMIFKLMLNTKEKHLTDNFIVIPNVLLHGRNLGGQSFVTGVNTVWLPV